MEQHIKTHLPTRSHSLVRAYYLQAIEEIEWQYDSGALETENYAQWVTILVARVKHNKALCKRCKLFIVERILKSMSERDIEFDEDTKKTMQWMNQKRLVPVAALWGMMGNFLPKGPVPEDETFHKGLTKKTLDGLNIQ